MPLLSLDRQGSGPTLVWLHGFTQSRYSAHQFRSILAGTHELLTLDLPGHGSAASLSASLDETADFIAEILPDEPVALGGYSLGGRVALHVALRHPFSVSRLVLVGASRGIEDVNERLARKDRDETLARHIEDVGTDTFLDEWLAQPMFSSLPNDDIERAARSSDAKGLAASLRASGTGTQTWLGPALEMLQVPVVAVAGREDLKFSLEAEAIAATVQRGSFQLIDNAGHAAHVEQPRPTAQVVTTFLLNE
jgi:2-succinyl-6-hydroxy-2,4-cyclohexadiene-1-carboxylate synthase